MLNELEVRKQYRIKISNRLAALEDLNDSEGINRVWENIQENIKISAKESVGLDKLKQRKAWFDEECLHFLDQRKHAKMHWIHDPNQSNVDNINHVGRDARRHFRNKKKEYLKAKIEELETNSKIKYIRELYWSISDFKKGYQPRTNIVQDEKGDLVTGSLSILPRWRKHFSQLFWVHEVNDVRQTEIHTSELLVPKLRWLLKC